jgi:hypothetical protein
VCQLICGNPCFIVEHFDADKRTLIFPKGFLHLDIGKLTNNPWNTVLEKLTNRHLIKEFRTLCTTRRQVVKASYLSLFGNRLSQFSLTQPISLICTLVLSFHLGLSLPNSPFLHLPPLHRRVHISTHHTCHKPKHFILPNLVAALSGSLLPRNGASSGRGRRIRLPGAKSSCEYMA